MSAVTKTATEIIVDTANVTIGADDLGLLEGVILFEFEEEVVDVTAQQTGNSIIKQKSRGRNAKMSFIASQSAESLLDFAFSDGTFAANAMPVPHGAGRAIPSAACVIDCINDSFKVTFPTGSYRSIGSIEIGGEEIVGWGFEIQAMADPTEVNELFEVSLTA